MSSGVDTAGVEVEGRALSACEWEAVSSVGGSANGSEVEAAACELRRSASRPSPLSR